MNVEPFPPPPLPPASDTPSARSPTQERTTPVSSRPAEPAAAHSCGDVRRAADAAGADALHERERAERERGGIEQKAGRFHAKPISQRWSASRSRADSIGCRSESGGKATAASCSRRYARFVTTVDTSARMRATAVLMLMTGQTLADGGQLCAEPRRAALAATFLLGPVVVILDRAGLADDLTLFVLAALALLPLSWLIGEATDNLAHYTGPGVGGFLNATFGNAPELIIAIVAIADGLHEIVRASLVGSIAGDLLLVLGFTLLSVARDVDRVSAYTSLCLVGFAALLLVGPSTPASTAIRTATRSR